MKAVALLLCCVAFAAALSVKSSPEARFAEVDVSADVEAGAGAKFHATVVSDRAYNELKHEQQEKAFAALHLPGSQPDLLAQAEAATEADEAEAVGAANDEELLALAAATESDSEADEADEETLSAVEEEVDAAEAESDAEDFALIEEADEEEDSEEAEDEDSEESEDEAEEESEEDMALLEMEDADEEEESDEDEAEEESEDEDEAEEESDEDAEEEDAVFIEADASPYISPVLVPGKPNKYNDAMPDATYDKTAESNLFPPAKYLVGAGPAPKAFTKAEIAAADAKIAKARALKAKRSGKKSAKKKAPRPAAKGKRSRRSRSRKALKKRGGRKARKAGGRRGRKSSRRAARRGRKARRGSRKARRGSRKGRKARKSRRGGRKARRGSKKSRRSRRGGKKSRKSARKARRARKALKGKLAKLCKKNPQNPRCIITPPYLQDIRDARHKHFIKSTNDLMNEVDDGILEHMVYPKIADPNKKGCKTGKGKGKKAAKKF